MPGITIRVNTAGMDAVEPERYRADLHAAMTEATQYLEGEVAKRTPVNFGTLRNSIFSEVAWRGSTLTGRVGTPLLYGEVMEEGRRPGSFPPRGPIELWAQRKLGNGRLWFVIARAIARRGIKGRHMFRDAAERGTGTVQRVFERWLSR